jgi:magnesium transporter
MPLRIIHTKKLKWVDVIKPDERDLTYLKENFKFHPLDFEDIMTESTRPKLDEYPEYHFLILLFPQYRKDTNQILPTEVDFFIGKDFIVTIHDGSMRTLTNIFRNVKEYDNIRSQYMGSSPGFLLFSILELLLKRSFPILDHISSDMDEAGKNVFELNIQTLQQFSHLKRNIIVYRRVMKMHKFILQKISRNGREYFAFKDSKVYFQNLIEYAETIWDVLAADKETAESYEETNQSLAGHRMNDILRVLTVFSVIIFILTLVINALLFVESISSIASWNYLLPTTVISLSVMTILMLLYFKNRKWL